MNCQSRHWNNGDFYYKVDCMTRYDCIIIGTGPSGLGAAFHLLRKKPALKVLLIDRLNVSSGGLRNDCKMNFTYPIGFPRDIWTKEQSDRLLAEVVSELKPDFMQKNNIGVYAQRAARLDTQLLEIMQSHLGTDGGLLLIKRLIADIRELGAEVSLGETMADIDAEKKVIVTDKRELEYGKLIAAPGRQGFRFLQKLMDTLGVAYIDHIVDIGIRVETREEHYPIVKDYYDPKFLFPEKVRTFCTNSGNAHVVQERYTTQHGDIFYSVNGHAYSREKGENRLVNFAMLKTVTFTEPLASGQVFAEMLGTQAMLMGGGKPIMQRVGDFRLGKRSKRQTFNGDLYDFEPTLPGCTPGDISLAMPARVLRGIWKSMKLLDTIVPGILHPSTIMYYPEIKLYANKPVFLDENFQAYPGVYLVGDGAGTSRGITAAWASGIRAADGILGNSTLTDTSARNG